MTVHHHACTRIPPTQPIVPRGRGVHLITVHRDERSAGQRNLDFPRQPIQNSAFSNRPLARRVVVSANRKYHPTSRTQRLEYLLAADVSDVHHHVALVRVPDNMWINETVRVRNKRDAYSRGQAR
jgi:hypothetical protein